MKTQAKCFNFTTGCLAQFSTNRSEEDNIL